MNSIKDVVLFVKKRKSAIHNLVLLSLVLGSVVLFVFRSVQLNKNEIWFSNMDADSTLLVESLMANSGIEPLLLPDPAIGSYIVYGNFLKLFEALNIVKVSEFNQLEASNDPLKLLPDLFYKGRTISIIISILCSLIFGFIFFLISRKLVIFSISTILFLSSGGLLFQSLIIRPELTSIFFILLSLLTLILYSKSKKPSFLTIITSGVLFGFAMLTKIQVLPILFFVVILLFYIVFITQKKYPEGLLKHSIIQFFFVIVILRIYIHFLNKIYHVYSNQSLPALLLLFILFIILSSMISMVPWFKKKRVPSLLNHINHFFIGFLISFMIVIYLANISSDNSMREIFNLAFQSGESGRVTQDLLHSMGGISNVFNEVVKFLKYYLLDSYMLIFLALFSTLIILTKKGFDYKITVTFIFGVGYCFFNSLRHFGPHYLIYSDIFFNATIVLLLNRLSSPGEGNNEPKGYFRKFWIGNILAILMLCMMVSSQLNYVRKEYTKYGADSRNLIDDIPYSHVRNKNYSEMMKKKYKNEVNIIERVYNDPYLNGSINGIDITEKVNYKTLGRIALPEVRDINLKLKDQDIINWEMTNLLKNIYQSDKDKFDEIKERILNKELNWSSEDVERRIVRKIPSILVNLNLNDEIEFVGYDLISFSQSKFEIIFYWKCLKSINYKYKVLGTIKKGNDSIDLRHILGYGGEHPTHNWKPGEIIKEIYHYRVPDYFGQGEYEMKLSLSYFSKDKEISPSLSVSKIRIMRKKEGAFLNHIIN